MDERGFEANHLNEPGGLESIENSDYLGEDLKDFYDKFREDVDALSWTSTGEKQDLLDFYQNNFDLIRVIIRKGYIGDQLLNKIVKMAQYEDFDSEKPFDNNFANLGREWIYTLEHSIEEQWDKGKIAPFHLLSAYSELVKHGNIQMTEAGLEGLLAHTDLIEQYLVEQKNEKFIEFARIIILNADDYDRQAFAHILKDVLGKKPDGKFSPAIISLFYESPLFEREGQNLVQEFLEKRGLQFEEVYPAWMVSTTPEPAKSFLSAGDQRGVLPFSKVIEYNLNVIREVEKEKPGTCKWLMDEWGIKDFGRYPSELLLMQNLRQDDSARPYGIAIYPRSDWNGAFYSSTLGLKTLMKDVKSEFNIRVAECENKVDIVRLLRKFNKKYNHPETGIGQKISLFILGGHGTEDSITFGRPFKRTGVLKIEDIDRLIAEESKGYFEENPTFMLASCSTGADGGIGEKISKHYNAKVFAPKIPSALVNIFAGRTRGGKWRFHADYTANAKRIFKQGNPVMK